ncbi:MAG: radical SAM family heme chaperone HemW [Gemmatimonadota bacterium]
MADDVLFGVRYEHLYIHVPFCARRCTYCDFSIAVRPSVPAGAFVDAVRSEWTLRHAPSTFALQTLYFGGGTPSKLGGEGVARLLDMVRERATLAGDAEVTLEANPEDVTADAVRRWRDAGVNRLSIGVQSFDDRVLTWMHRTHDASGARQAVAVARDAGIDNISIDLIFALPASVGREWGRDLDAAQELRLPHLSVYGLTVEPRTPLGRWVARRETVEAPEENFESEFLVAHERLTASGLEHYEVSNYGAPQRHSRHNWAYWQRRPYGGLGPSAHEFDGATRRWNVEAFAAWESVAVRGDQTVAGSEQLDADQAHSERTYLGLRTSAGLTASPDVVAATSTWVESGWATAREGVLRLTPRGWLRLDALVADLTMLRSRY